MKQLALFVFWLLFPVGARAVSVVLIPTLYIGPGAFGSRWSTLLVLNNHMDVAFASPGVTFVTLCGLPEGCVSETVPPGSFGSVEGPRPINGLLLYLPAEDAAIIFMARLAALPRNTSAEGTELPVVRESAFSRGTLRFPYVPLVPVRDPLRTTLRIYAPDAQPGSSVRVELRSWSDPTGPAIATKTVTLEAPASPKGSAVPIYPGFAQVNLQDEFPAVSQTNSLCNVAVISLPLNSESTPRIWAFITITDNITQEVAVQRPQ